MDAIDPYHEKVEYNQVLVFVVYERTNVKIKRCPLLRHLHVVGQEPGLHGFPAFSSSRSNVGQNNNQRRHNLVQLSSIAHAISRGLVVRVQRVLEGIIQDLEQDTQQRRLLRSRHQQSRCRDGKVQ